MTNTILFIQGGGEKGYEIDKELVDSLKRSLGESYEINYPRMQTTETLQDFGWIQQIEDKIKELHGSIILVGHSLGASLLLKYLSERKIETNIKGVFLISTPFWSGDEDWVQGLKLKEDFNEKLSKETPIFFYQCKDDDTNPISHFTRFKSKVPWATFCLIEQGGHQLNNDLSQVADDIKLLGP